MLCLKNNKRKKKYEVKRIKETLYVTKETERIFGRICHLEFKGLLNN